MKSTVPINFTKLANTSAMSSLVVGLIAFGTLAVPSTASAGRIGTTVPYNGSACPEGFVRGSFSHRSYDDPSKCYDTRSDAAVSTVNVTKTNRLDRCPLGYFTSDVDPMSCATMAERPPTVRAKGSGPCRAGEVEDWGIWCVSNYAGLTASEAATGSRDWNAIYALNDLQRANQEDLPEGSEYSPAYITIFGRIDHRGRPMGGGAGPARSASVSPPAAPVAAADTRRGSMSPQPINATSFGVCPTFWVPGQGDRDFPDRSKCYPSARATPIFPVAGTDAPCPDTYFNAISWCVAREDSPDAAAARAGTLGAATAPGAQAATPANCPPAGGGAAQQAGAALGGLLVGRRGNSQAGAALGGLLGQAAGAAAQRPAGCP